MWTQSEAVELCRVIESICPPYGCHVALTGGALYKDGPRKDADILFYRVRQVDQIDIPGLFESLAGIGVIKQSGFGWCHKAEWRGKAIDIFFPEEVEGEYKRPASEDLR